jgi:hypothetical protein
MFKKTNYKRTDNEVQNTTQNLDWATQNPTKIGDKLKVSRNLWIFSADTRLGIHD